MRCRSLVLTLAFAAALPLSAQTIPAYKASLDTFQIPSHGSLMNALVYVAAGEAPHPAVVLLHGFPGNERNLDLAQDLRRAGYDVVYFNYRGAWGSQGAFSFGNGIEDVSATLAYLRDPANAKRLRLDPSNIILIGHSMGGFMAVEGAAADPGVRAIGLISAADMAGRIPAGLPPQAEPAVTAKLAPALAREGISPLAGCTAESLAQNLFAHADAWRFSTSAAALATRPMLVVTSDDGLAPANDAFVTQLRAAGDKRVETQHFATDHSYSDMRLELSAAVLKWLRSLPK